MSVSNFKSTFILYLSVIIPSFSLTEVYFQHQQTDRDTENYQCDIKHINNFTDIYNNINFDGLDSL